MFSVSATSLFSRQTEKLFAEDEMRDLIGYRSEFPLPGDGIPATGGVRKLPYAVSGRGKRGGAQIVYCYPGDRLRQVCPARRCEE